MAPIQFKLYIAGQTPRSQRAVANLRRMAAVELGNRCELRVIDVTQEPEAAEADRILTTPTLIKLSPPPERRVTGDLSDAEQVLFGLALDPSGHDGRTDPGTEEFR